MKGAETIQELIDLLQQCEDKTRRVHVWDDYGYYGSNLVLEVDTKQNGSPLMIISERR